MDEETRPRTRQRLRIQTPVIDLSNEDNDDSDEEEFPFPLHLGDTSRSPSPSSAVIADDGLIPLPPWDRASSDDILEWQMSVLGAVIRVGQVAVDITGPSLSAIARTLSSAIGNNQDPTHPFVVAPGVTCILKPTDLGFFDVYRRYIIENPRDRAQNASGDGPERGHYTTALKLRVADPERVREQSRWADSGAFFRPTFDEKPYHVGSARCQDFFIDGRYAALAMVQLASAPLPMCPIVIYMATQPSLSCLDDLSLPFIATLDPHTARILRPWFEIGPDRVFAVSGDSANPGQDEGHMGLLLATELLGISILEFKIKRAPLYHRELNRRLLAMYFTGTPAPWDHAEFRTFRIGLLLKLSPQLTLSDFLSTELKVRRLLVGLYDRTVKTAADITGRLEFTTKEDDTEIISLFFKLFRSRFGRWLSGTGFPKELKSKVVVDPNGSRRLVEGIISDEQYKSHKNSPGIRGTTFLASLTESSLLPVCSTDALIISLSFTNQSGESDYGQPRVWWHSCHRTVEIHLNAWLKNMLLEPCSLDDIRTNTAFDIWMSKITSLQAGDYNRV
ncbi:hypothetical protein C8R47DRAFT_814044 [Mycena vitilis]|nr:hypothetical protein C8R47DRAFT_814044 [Mycena vitilis]